LKTNNKSHFYSVFEKSSQKKKHRFDFLKSEYFKDLKKIILKVLTYKIVKKVFDLLM